MNVLQATGAGLLFTGLAIGFAAIAIHIESDVPRVQFIASMVGVFALVLIIAGGWFSLYGEVAA